jgi:DNA polymerase (family 10)
VLHGCEVEIRSDGSLDLDDGLLGGFDVVVAALHQGRRQSRERLTQRVVAALRSPHVDILAHPSGRMIEERPELELDWDAVFEVAAATGTFLEINASDHRLDLDDARARMARDAGCRLVIDTDAHRVEELEAMRWGLGVARRAWLEASDVANTMSRDELLEWVAGKPGRVARARRASRVPRGTIGGP